MAHCFAVKRGIIKERADVNYSAASSLLSRLHAQPKFPFKPIRDIAFRLQYGISSLATSEPVGLPIVRMNNLQNDGWDFTNLKYIDLPSNEAETYKIIPGDILFNRTNSKELVGKCEVFREEGHWVFASYLIRVSLDETKALPDFVSGFLNTKAGRAQIDRVSRQIVGMSNVNAEEIRELLIPLPPVEKQRMFVAELEAARHMRQAKLAQIDELLSGLDAYLLAQLGLAPPAEDKRQTFAVRLSQLRTDNRLNADYFHPERVVAVREQQNRKGLRAEGLSDVVDFIRDIVTADASENYVGLANVQSHTGEIVESSDERAGGQCFAFVKDDVLFGRLRPYLNKVHRAECSGVCSTEFHVMRIREPRTAAAEIMPDYLATILRSSLILAQTTHMMTGNTHPRLTNEDVINLVIPLPKLNVQKAIASEVQRRRVQARKLREEAAREWAAAKAHFERKLLGEEA